MRKIKQFFILFLIQFLVSLNPAEAQEEKEITQLLKSYISEINTLSQSKKIDNLKKLLADDFMAHESEIALNGSVRHLSRNRETHLRLLQQRIAYAEGISIDASLERIFHATSGEKTAYIMAELKINVQYEGNPAEKVSIFVNAIGSKIDGIWKLTETDNVIMVDEKTLGKCLCSFYERDAGFATEVVYPSGFAYEKKMDAFTFRLQDGVKTISVNDQLYHWKQNGEIVNITDGKGGKALGTTNDSKKAATIVLSDLYQTHCIEFIMR